MRILFVSLSVIIIDQVTKFLVKGLNIGWLGIHFQGMPYGTSRRVFGELVKITFIENPGMAFGFDVGPKMFLTLFTIIASLIILYYIYKHRYDGFLMRLALAFILAGAVGNLIDRTFYGLIYGYAPLFFGKVVDFVQVEFWDFTLFGKTYTTWPIFNVADFSVTVGFLILLVFNKKVFRAQEPVSPEAISGESSSINNNEIKNPDVINNKTSEITPLKFEDTK
ncbi:MAG: signal peptidase II [Ignavibacteria bacterium]